MSSQYPPLEDAGFSSQNFLNTEDDKYTIQNSRTSLPKNSSKKRQGGAQEDQISSDTLIIKLIRRIQAEHNPPTPSPLPPSVIPCYD